MVRVCHPWSDRPHIEWSLDVGGALGIMIERYWLHRELERLLVDDVLLGSQGRWIGSFC